MNRTMMTMMTMTMMMMMMMTMMLVTMKAIVSGREKSTSAPKKCA